MTLLEKQKFKCAGYTESMNDGEGVAFVVYFQGCYFNCPGCHNKELQDPDGGEWMDIDFIVSKFAEGKDFYDSFVFLGGEPLEQIEAVRTFIEKLLPYNKKLWLYTGFTPDRIPQDIQEKIDVIIAGPYDQKKATNGFPASSNQVIITKHTTTREDF